MLCCSSNKSQISYSVLLAAHPMGWAEMFCLVLSHQHRPDPGGAVGSTCLLTLLFHSFSMPAAPKEKCKYDIGQDEL